MSTHAQRQRARRAAGPTVRVSLDDLISSNVSMLSEAMLPQGYDLIGDTSGAVAAAYEQEDMRIIRLHIVWDNPINTLDLERALDYLRETGAAMVVKAEAVK